MERSLVVRGHLRGKHIELDEAVDTLDGDVEVMVRSIDPQAAAEDIFTFIRMLPPGTRTKEDIDRQIAEERDGWGER